LKYLITGSAGFIGSSLAVALLERNDEVLGIDNILPYQDIRLSHARLARCLAFERYQHSDIDIRNGQKLGALIQNWQPQVVIHLAARAGVRAAEQDPQSYIDTNIQGFFNIMEACRKTPVEALVYASSSSVYGGIERLPYHESMPIEHPLNLYAATKKANELLAYSYSHLHHLPTIGMRFFTVYGPWCRPDMALLHFALSIKNGKPIDLYNYGRHRRDFTYINDIIQGLLLIIDHWESKLEIGANGPYAIYNIGSGQPIPLAVYVSWLEQYLGYTAIKEQRPRRSCDMLATYADITAIHRDFGYQPQFSIEEGIRRFSVWFHDFYA